MKSTTICTQINPITLLMPLILLAFTFTTTAQPLLPKKRALLVGVSNPVGSYEDENFAKPGVNVTYERTSFLLKYVGIGSIISYQNHPIDNDAFALEMENSWDNVSSANVDAKDYQSVVIMFGAYFRLPFLEDKWEVQSKFGGGVHFASIGKTSADLTYTTGRSDHIKFDGEGDIGLSYYGGISVQYNVIGKHLGIRLSSNYINIPYEYDISLEGASTQDITIDGNMSFINTSLGIMINIL